MTLKGAVPLSLRTAVSADIAIEVALEADLPAVQLRLQRQFVSRSIALHRQRNVRRRWMKIFSAASLYETIKYPLRLSHSPATLMKEVHESKSI